jgi:hypothetical protein
MCLLINLLIILSHVLLSYAIKCLVLSIMQKHITYISCCICVLGQGYLNDDDLNNEDLNDESGVFDEDQFNEDQG